MKVGRAQVQIIFSTSRPEEPPRPPPFLSSGCFACAMLCPGGSAAALVGGQVSLSCEEWPVGMSRQPESGDDVLCRPTSAGFYRSRHSQGCVNGVGKHAGLGDLVGIGTCRWEPLKHHVQPTATTTNDPWSTNPHCQSQTKQRKVRLEPWPIDGPVCGVSFLSGPWVLVL